MSLRRSLLPILAVFALAAVLLGGAPASDATAVLGAHGAVVQPAVHQALARQPTVRVLVTLREPLALRAAQLDVDALRAQVATTQAAVLADLPPPDFDLARRYQAVPALAGQVNADGLAALAAHPEVVDVGLDKEVRATLGESVAQINADDAHDLGLTGDSVVATVLDTGIDTDYPDLADDLLSEHCFLFNPGPGPCSNGLPEESGPGSAEDDNGHGTHVSGIITSGGLISPTGVAPDTSIHAYKVLDSTGSGVLSDVLAAADHIIVNIPETDLINLSLGDGANHAPGSCDGLIPAVDAAIDTLRAGGTTIIASSGNEGFKDGMGYPACLSTVISVGAVYDADVGSFTFSVCSDGTTAQDQIICFSNSDESLDLLAPGCVTTSSVPGGGTAGFCGTSMAAPHAVGAAALVLQNDPALSPDGLKACLKTSGVPLLDAANGVTTPRIDALDALGCGGLSPVGGIAESPTVLEAPLVHGRPGADVTLPSVVFWTALVGAIAICSAGWYVMRRRPRH